MFTIWAFEARISTRPTQDSCRFKLHQAERTDYIEGEIVVDGERTQIPE